MENNNRQGCRWVKASGVNDLAAEIHNNAKEKGFFDKEKNIGEMLALIHSEVSEALEADRKDMYCDWSYGDPPVIQQEDIDDFDFKQLFEQEVKNNFEDELADIMIRVMDLAAFKKINLEWHIQAKMRYNSLREKYHGKKY
jgi:NTP pyrophosphatase (non-canonical NTP hydrolase)